MGSQLALKSRIASTASLEKIFNAQEMIASSHIAKARDVALNAKPYTDAIFDAVQALVAHTHITHPIAVKDPEILERIYQVGRRDGEARVADVERYLA